MSSLQAEPRIVRIGAAPMPPLAFVDEQGEVNGVIVQVVESIAERNNWQVEWVMDSWANQLARLERGEIDLMGAIGYSEERAQRFDFSDESVLSVWGQLYVQPGLSVNNFLQLDGRRIAVLKDGISGQRFAQLCSRFAVNCILLPKNSYREVFESINSKEVAGGVVNSHYGFVVESNYDVVRSDIMFDPFPVLFATKKNLNADLLATIDESLNLWKADSSSVYYDITNQWIAQTQKNVFPAWVKYTLLGLTGASLFGFLMVLILRREVRRRTQALSLSEAQLKQIINLVPHAIFATDATGKIILANKATNEVFDRTSAELKKVTRAELMRQEPNLVPLLGDDEKIMGRQTGDVAQEIEVELNEIDSKTYQITKVPFVRRASHIPAVVSVAVDITESKRSSERIEHLAKHDGLTDLPNRTLLMDRLNQSLALSKRHGRVGAVLFIDLDLFKNVNDTLGHSVGDVLLQVTAARIKKHCRESDTVARFGGDEFVVLLNELGDSLEEAKVNALNIAKKIRREVIQEAFVDKHELSVSVSQGIVFFPYDAKKGDSVIKRADMAMYHAKNMGRNKIVIFHYSMEEIIRRKERLKLDLKQAIKRNDIFLVYQPQFDTRNNRFLGVEALARWSHEQEHIIFPLEFIPIAEESGSILELGQMLLRQACEQVMQWREQFGVSLYVTVNLSARQIASKGLVKYIEDLIRTLNFPVELLELEVTESMLMDDMDNAVAVLGELKSKGIKISLDDFGTGYSSLSYLKKLPLDKLKIDKSFVNDIPGDSDSETIARTIISMANQLGLEVVAEGVENKPQVEFFKANGCYLFQGYYFSPPCRSDELANKLSNIIPFDKKINSKD